MGRKVFLFFFISTPGSSTQTSLGPRQAAPRLSSGPFFRHKNKEQEKGEKLVVIMQINAHGNS
jgi:hypothetical protein